MIIQEIPRKYWEGIIGLEGELFGRDAFNRIAIIHFLRVFSETCLAAVQENQIVGYTFGLVKSTGEGWVSSLGVLPRGLAKQRIALLLALELQKRMMKLNVKVGYATTKRPEIISLSRLFNGRVIEEIKDYFLDGERRYLIEFRPPVSS